MKFLLIAWALSYLMVWYALCQLDDAIEDTDKAIDELDDAISDAEAGRTTYYGSDREFLDSLTDRAKTATVPPTEPRREEE